ncbi:AIPR family protein [Agrobacterium sp. NPDC090273]|uniref:AIPR family protein n=1 Tax=Agrobacterium sp. NPDC090273 TaxID=3363919 RepID=UPI00383A6E4D
MPMNPVIKAQLSEFRKANPGEDGSDSDLFEVMSIFAVENGLLAENIDPFRAHLKGAEFGVDGIAILIQGVLCTDADEAASVLAVGKQHTGAFHFYQSKTSDGLDYGELSKFLDGVYDFFTDLKLLSGDQVADLSEVKELIFQSATKSNPELRCYYCTTGSGEVSDAINKLIESNKSRFEALNIFGDITVECIGAKAIQEGFRAATNSTAATLNFPKAVTMPAHARVDEAFIGFVSADQILGIAWGPADADGSRHINRTVFYDNVRDFNPDSDINRAVINELQSGDYSSFVFKNNGITVVAKSITRKGDAFSIEDYQIVNGCQTTNILSHVPDHAHEIFVPLRLIGSNDPDFVASIIIGTNKQNEVRDDQFWALLPFMKDLEVYCSAQEGDARILVERRDNQYRDVAVERTRIMKPSDLMKVAAAMFFFQPHRAARDHRGIRNEFSSRIFRENHSVEFYHVAALALYKFDYLIRAGKIERSRVIYKFYVLFSLIREHWKSPDVLDAHKRQQKFIRQEVLNIISDNERFAGKIESVANCLDGIVRASGEKTREQIRDFIRTDAVSELFVEAYFKR